MTDSVDDIASSGFGSLHDAEVHLMLSKYLQDLRMSCQQSVMVNPSILIESLGFRVCSVQVTANVQWPEELERDFEELISIYGSLMMKRWDRENYLLRTHSVYAMTCSGNAMRKQQLEGLT